MMKPLHVTLLLAAGLFISAPAQETARRRAPADSPSMAPTVTKDGTVTFTLAAPKATTVTVGGDWGGGRVAMTKDANGVWTGSVQLKPQIYSYTFMVDGVRTLDPANTQLKIGRVINASSIEVPGSPPKSWEMRDVPHGTVTSITYRSPATDDQRRITVYTPPGYQPDQAARLPVLYLLHGTGEIESSWVQYGRANLIADSLIAEGRMQPMVIVMPNGHAYKPGETPAAGVRPTSVFQEDLLSIIIPLVEKTYRVRTDQPNRAIMGLSMGGGQSLSIGLSHLDRFSHLGIFSAGGSRDPGLIARVAADPKSTNAKLKLFWIGCGRDDQGFAGAQKLTDDLTKAGIRHTFLESDGAHTWINWREYLSATLPLLFQ